MMFIRKLLIRQTVTAFIILLSCLSIFAQTPKRVFNEITYKDGLFGNWNYELYQDHKGFIWIGGINGLQRYDGYEFRNYDQGIFVFNIHEDTRGLLWISTNTGIYVLNPENEKSIQYVPFPKDTLGFFTFNRINKTIEAKNGLIWCATQNGLLKLEPKIRNGSQLKELMFSKGFESAFNISVFKIYQTDGTEGENRILEIYEDERDRLWIGSSRGLYIFNDEKNEYFHLDNDGSGKTKLNSYHVFDIEEENPDVFWVRDINGFTRISNIKRAISDTFIDTTHLEFEKYTLMLGGDYGYIVNRFLIDSQHNFWIGTRSDGLIKMKIDENQNVTFEEAYSEMPESGGALFDEVTSILEDKTGLLWACQASSGIRTFREGNDLFIPLEGMLQKYHMMKYDFNQIYEDEDGNLWICSWGSGLFKISKDRKVHHYQITDGAHEVALGNYISSLVEIDKGIFWIGGLLGIWQFDAGNGKFQELLKESFAKEKSKAVWGLRKAENHIHIATQDQGYWIYNLKTKKLKQFTASQKDTPRLIDDWIFSMDQLNNGEIWVNTRRKGLYRFGINDTTEEYEFLPLPKAIMVNYQILCEKGINHIYADKNNILWFCKQTGLFRLDPESGELRKWTTMNGLSNNNVLSVKEDNKGNLWVAPDHELSMLDPVTGKIKTFGERDGLPRVLQSVLCSL